MLDFSRLGSERRWETLGVRSRQEALRQPRTVGIFAAGVLAVIGLGCAAAPARAASEPYSGPSFSIPTSARQLIVVSSRRYDPVDFLANFRTFERADPTSPWKRVFPTWKAEIGSGGLLDMRREGDHATPTGTYPLGLTMYGNSPNPGGLHTPYHQLACGDWWDEDPYSSQYNQFVHIACGFTPTFAAWSEALWTETDAYPYFAVIDFNDDPTDSGTEAPGSGIFLHAWVWGPTEGCVALHVPSLLRVLRWLQPADHPVIEIGTDTEVGSLPPASALPARRPLRKAVAHR